jgi:signal transduction histidine kinase
MWYDGKTRPYAAQPNNYKEIFQTGHSTMYNVALANGGDLGNYRISYTYNDYQPIQFGSNNNKHTFSFNSQLKVSKKLTTEFIVNYYKTYTHNRPKTMNFLSGYSFNRAEDPALARELYKKPDGYQYTMIQSEDPDNYLPLNTRSKDLMNYYWDMFENSYDESEDRLMANMTLNFKFNEWLKLRARGGTDYTLAFYEQKVAYTKPKTLNANQGQYNVFDYNYRLWYADAVMTGNKKFGDFDLNLDLGATVQSTNNRFRRNWTKDGLDLEGWYSLSNSISSPYWSEYSRQEKLKGGVFTDDFLPLILQSGIFALLLSLVVAFFFARWIADPLQKVVAAARQMPSAEIKPVEPQGPHEVQELTRAFNSMISRTQASQKSQREFVANVSHELKTPLTSVQGFAQALLDGTADSIESRQQAAQVIYDESARMHRMVLDLLDLARLDAGTADITMAPMNMPALLNAIAEKFTPQLQQAGVTVKVDAPATLATVTADGDRLAQVFTNLVDNALKFTPRGGLISLRISAEDKEMLISVSDSGTGIPPEALAHIFHRFYQADSARTGGERHGVGLGLAIAHEIVQAHGGRIGVRSRLGEGTTFDVFLPLNIKQAHQ